MLTVAFESKRLFESSTGFGTYCRTLVSDLDAYHNENSYVLVAPKSYAELTGKVFFRSEEVQRIKTLNSVSVVYPPKYFRLYWQLLDSQAQLRDRNVDLYHGLTQQVPRSVRSMDVPKVLSIHDLIYRYFPGNMDTKALERHDRALRSACSASDHIIAVSESTKNDLIDEFSIVPEKVTVIYSACDARYHIKVPEDAVQRIKSKYALPDKYILSVGSMSERKNLLMVVKSLNDIPPIERLPLVVIGAETDYTKLIKKYVDQNKLSDWIIFLDNVVSSDLPSIYQAAALSVYISRYEGFGMPILESLASGTPVVTSNISAMPEAGGPSSRKVDPLDIQAISENIQQITNDRDLRDSLAREGLLHAKRFKGELICDQIINLYQQEIGKYS